MPSTQLQSGSVLLLDVLETRQAQLFQDPLEVLTCRSVENVRDFLNQLEERRNAGHHLAGFMAYELGYAFEQKLRAKAKAQDGLLAWFGVYDAPIDLSLNEAKALLADTAGKSDQKSSTPATIKLDGFDMSAQSYDKAFAQVQDHLAKGDIYQVNLTIRGALSHQGSAEANFLRLLEAQPVAYAAVLKLEDCDILSLSPELFLERQGSTLRTKPMKGTAARGMTEVQDRVAARKLAADPKQQAENVMIVDLMRNDLSRIAVPGSVKVTRKFEVEHYRSLLQMTSTIEAQLEDQIAFPQIIENLFPCGSITGAPKLSAMTIADRLETSPRGVYTGSIGAIQPNGDFRFNVAIRTLVLNHDGTGEVGTGSGVVFDSGASPEYDECALKLKFLEASGEPFQLLETMRWSEDDGYMLLERHIARLMSSARYFGFEADEAEVRSALDAFAKTLTSDSRVRLLMSDEGGITLSATDLPVAGASDVWKIIVSDQKADPRSPFLFHKTTRRDFYDQGRALLPDGGNGWEVVFENTEGFLTEGSYTNLFIKKEGRLLTPALRHGLLPGTLRSALLENGLAFEADLTRADLMDADEIYLANSVRGMIRADLAV